MPVFARESETLIRRGSNISLEEPTSGGYSVDNEVFLPHPWMASTVSAPI